MDDYKQPLWSKILEFIVIKGIMLLIAGTFLIWIFISIWPILACVMGLCEVEIGRPGEGDCNPNSLAVNGC